MKTLVVTVSPRSAAQKGELEVTLQTSRLRILTSHYIETKPRGKKAWECFVTLNLTVVS